MKWSNETINDIMNNLDYSFDVARDLEYYGDEATSETIESYADFAERFLNAACNHSIDINYVGSYNDSDELEDNGINWEYELRQYVWEKFCTSQIFRKSTINLPEYQWDYLEQVAIKTSAERKQKISMAEYLRELIDKDMNSSK